MNKQSEPARQELIVAEALGFGLAQTQISCGRFAWPGLLHPTADFGDRRYCGSRMQLFETGSELACGLALLTEGWHPLILYPPPWVVEVIYLPGEIDPWSYRHHPQIGTALAFIDGLRQTLGADALPVWSLERLLADYRLSSTQFWRFRAEFLFEQWEAESHSIADLLEGRTVAVGWRPFVLVYQQAVELWSRPPRPPAHFREDEEPACEDHRYSPSPIRKEFGE